MKSTFIKRLKSIDKNGSTKTQVLCLRLSILHSTCLGLVDNVRHDLTSCVFYIFSIKYPTEWVVVTDNIDYAAGDRDLKTSVDLDVRFPSLAVG